MEKRIIAGLEINKVSIMNLLFNKTMILAYILLALGLYGVYEVFQERYFLIAANAHDAGLNPGSKEVAHAMKEAIFGAGGEVKREAPWSLYIVNYMYMIYTGSGIIFLVALAELFDVEMIKKTAAGFMTFGLAMVFGGLFTIAVDLNILHMHWMFLTPNMGAGMWLMLPLYLVYIPFVMFEIYLLITKNHAMAKKFAIPVLILSIAVDVVEYYIQAKLFDMNTARHLWTTYPMLTLYFIVSAFVASAGVMLLFSLASYQAKLGEKFCSLMFYLRKIALYMIIILGAYEATAYLFIDKDWGGILLFGEFKYYFYAYIITAVGIPFVILFRSETSRAWQGLAAIFLVVGTYLGRLMFVYGGNAFPMSDRFGTGFQKYGEYEPIKDYIFFMPHLGEFLIVIGSAGVVLAVYKLIDSFLSVSDVRDH